MLKSNVPPNPNNFMVWYHHHAGIYPDLSKALAEVLDAKEPFTNDLCEDIFRRFFSFDREGSLVNESTEKLNEELERVIQTISTVDGSARTYGNELQSASSEIQTAGSGANLREVIERIRATTDQMITQNKTLQNQLQVSSLEVKKLRTDVENLRNDSLTDGLTNIANRKHFDTMLRSLTEQAQSEKMALCLVMLDVDHFKKFNDTWGHQVGDQVLKLVAHTLKENVKGRDLPARYGGEEFGIILPNTSLTDARTLAEKIRGTIANKDLVNRKSGARMGRITISLGIARYQFGESLTNLIGRADKALYQAKGEGRNRVVTEAQLT
ncbi:MAG: GGDEF domain-containing protein [Magnetospiraceae bacterium]